MGSRLLDEVIAESLMPKAARLRDNTLSFAGSLGWEIPNETNHIQSIWSDVPRKASQKLEVVGQTGDEVNGAVFATESKRWIEVGQRGAVVSSFQKQTKLFGHQYL